MNRRYNTHTGFNASNGFVTGYNQIRIDKSKQTIDVDDVVTPNGSLSDLFLKVARLEKESAEQTRDFNKLKLKYKKLKMMVLYAPGSQEYINARDDFNELANEKTN